MYDTINVDLEAYNTFCKNLKEGCILYNIDSTNLWGDYLLVANISTIKVGVYKTYGVLLIGLKKEESKFVPRNLIIRLTPEYINNIPFLKYVGHCKFKLIPEIIEINVNLGLATVYSNTDLHKFAKKISVRKPKSRIYEKDGSPVGENNN